MPSIANIDYDIIFISKFVAFFLPLKALYQPDFNSQRGGKYLCFNWERVGKTGKTQWNQGKRRRGSNGRRKGREKSRRAEASVRRGWQPVRGAFPSIPHSAGKETLCGNKLASGRINRAVHSFVLFPT